MRLFMEPLPGSTQHYGLHASVSISALPLDLAENSFGILLFRCTAQQGCTTSRETESSEPVFHFEIGGVWHYELES